MNASENDTERPFGYWLKAVDRLMAAEFDAAFHGEGASRRDWRLLNLVDGTVPSDRPLPHHKAEHLADRGWIIAEGDGWALTDDGRAAKERLGALVDGIRAKVTDAVAPDDLATTLASLESIARAFGWEEGMPLPRRRGRDRGRRQGHDHEHAPAAGRGRRAFARFGRAFGPVVDHVRTSVSHGDDAWGHGHGFGHGSKEHERGHGQGHGHGHGHGGSGFGHPAFDQDGFRGENPEHCHGHGRRHGNGARHHRHPIAAAAQHAYERGFDAGFLRGREA